ncbi:hypothetical protein P8452_18956 [Trifolium repens]|nr:hypothetical protein P8452_18956 [Trifolium repens]
MAAPDPEPMSPSQLLKSGLSTFRNQKDRLMLLYRNPCRHAIGVLRYRTRLLIDKYTLHPTLSEEDKRVDQFLKQYKYLGTGRDSFDCLFQLFRKK